MTNLLDNILQTIYRKSPLQKKKIEKHLSKRNTEYTHEVEAFLSEYIPYLETQNLTIDYAIDAYLLLCSDMMKAQIEFMKTGKYPVNSTDYAFENVYNKKNKMQSYMVGLAISQFLWSSHYEIYKFFSRHIKTEKDLIGSYLEIGSGHGLFLRKVLSYLGNKKKIHIVDISPISIAITKSMVDYFMPNSGKISYFSSDILDYNTENKYDFISMGEVLEHVNFPDKLLLKLKNLMIEEGKAFVSTCVNAPAIDHVYHFKSIDEIKQMVHSCGLHIEEELVLPVEDLPWDEIVNRKIAVNYCAILSRRRDGEI